MSLGKLKDLKDECEANTTHFYVTVDEARRGRSREIKREYLGFEPDVTFMFRTWGGLAADAEEELVRGTLALCRATPGDAALLFNLETILFIRKADTIYVNTLYYKGDYSLFPPPYELKAFKVDDPPF